VIAALAQAALYHVFQEHGGFLQSFEVDGHQRLACAYRIIGRAVVDDGELDHLLYNQREATRRTIRYTRVMEAVPKLLRIVPDYVCATYRQMDLSTEAAEVMAQFEEHIHIRMRETAVGRSERAERLLLDFRNTLSAMQGSCTYIDWRYRETIPTVRGPVSIAPLRLALNDKLRLIIPQFDPSVKMWMTENDDLDGLCALRWFHHGTHKHLRQVDEKDYCRSEYSDISVGSISAAAPRSDDGDFYGDYNHDHNGDMSP
jgi:hypothetical protein